MLSNWPVDSWCDQDHSYGGAWLRGNNKGGFLSLSRMCLGYPSYVSGGQFNESTYHQANIFSEADILSVVQGAAPYSILPIPYAFTSLPFDYSTMLSVLKANVVSITSIMGDIEVGPDHPTNPKPGAFVTCDGAHGLTEGNHAFIHGTGVNEYNNAWTAYTGRSGDDSTHFHIGDNNHDNRTWEGTTANAGTVRGDAPSNATLFGLAYNRPTQKVYIGWVNNIGPTGMISQFRFDDSF